MGPGGFRVEGRTVTRGPKVGVQGSGVCRSRALSGLGGRGGRAGVSACRFDGQHPAPQLPLSPSPLLDSVCGTTTVPPLQTSRPATCHPLSPPSGPLQPSLSPTPPTPRPQCCSWRPTWRQAWRTCTRATWFTVTSRPPMCCCASHTPHAPPSQPRWVGQQQGEKPKKGEKRDSVGVKGEGLLGVRGDVGRRRVVWVCWAVGMGCGMLTCVAESGEGGNGVTCLLLPAADTCLCATHNLTRTHVSHLPPPLPLLSPSF